MQCSTKRPPPPTIQISVGGTYFCDITNTGKQLCSPNEPFVVVLEKGFFKNEISPFGVDFEICNFVDCFMPKHTHYTLTKIHKVKKHNRTPLKLQSLSFASLSLSLFENLELQFLAELSSLRRLYSGTAPARMNLMFWGECVAVSHRTGVDVYYTSQSQILAYVLEYMTQKNHFHRILSSEQESNKSAMFVLPNWGKKQYNKSRYQWWLNLTID